MCEVLNRDTNGEAEPTTIDIHDPTTFVDRDILDADNGAKVDYDPIKERGFKEFFEITWLLAEFDDLREKWDPLIRDKDSHGRALAKTALWSVIQLRNHSVDS